MHEVELGAQQRVAVLRLEHEQPRESLVLRERVRRLRLREADLQRVGALAQQRDARRRAGDRAAARARPRTAGTPWPGVDTSSESQSVSSRTPSAVIA